MRQQLRNVTRPLRRQAREDVLQISIRIMPVEPSRLDQAHDRRHPFAAAQRTCKSSQPKGVSPLGCSQNRT